MYPRQWNGYFGNKNAHQNTVFQALAERRRLNRFKPNFANQLPVWTKWYIWNGIRIGLGVCEDRDAKVCLFHMQCTPQWGVDLRNCIFVFETIPEVLRISGTLITHTCHAVRLIVKCDACQEDNWEQQDGRLHDEGHQETRNWRSCQARHRTR